MRSREDVLKKRERRRSFGARRINAKREKRSLLRSVAVRKRREITRKQVELLNNDEQRLLPKQNFAPPVHLDVQAGGLFAEKDAKRVASLGEKYRFLIPDFRIDSPGNDVQSSLRGFVGIWLDGEGKGRTHLIIVTRVHQDGTADGFPSSGPPTPSSFDKRASWSRDNCRKDSGDTLRFSEPKGLSSTGSF